MRKGFSHEVAPGLIAEEPGRPAEYYADKALYLGLSASDSKSPVHSLASTLRKEAREGRLPELYTQKRGGRLCFFPVDGSDGESEAGPVGQSNKQPRERVVTVHLGEDIHSVIDHLIDIGRHRTASDAIRWMVGQWFRQNAGYVRRVHKAANQVRAIRTALAE